MQFRQSSSLRFIASAVALLLTGFIITQALRLNDSVVTASAQAGYNIIDLGTLGGVESRAYGLNAFGQVAGYSHTPNGKPHAFMWDGTLHDLGTLPGAQESFAWAINDAGQVAGASSDLGSPTTRAFLWQNGQMTDLGEFSPRAINNRGEVAGSLNVKRKNVPWTEHACLWRNGALTDLGTLGGNNSFACSVNDLGQVVGLSFARDQARVRAFIWSNGVMTDLGTLGGSTGQAYALGNGGRVVGYADTPNGAPHGFLFTLSSSGNVSSRTDLGAGGGAYSYAYAINSLGQAVGTNGHAVLWQDGVMSDLNTLIPPDTGWVLMSATAINDRGEIAGWGTYQGFTRAFVLRR